MTENIAVYAPGQDFVLPYIVAALPGCGIYSISLPDGTLIPENKKAVGKPELYIMISSTDIYGTGAMEDITEDTPADPDSEWTRNENSFRDFAAAQHHEPVILRCADARRSIPHATDLGRIAHTLATAGVPDRKNMTYNVTDGSDPTIHDFAEALAYRMNNKRISTLSTRPQQWIGKKIYGEKRYALYTSSRTFSSGKLKLDMAFRATDTCEYLRTHVYDQNSL